MGRTLSKKFPIIGYIAVWPSNRIVKVKVEKCDSHTCGYPFVVTPLEKGVKIWDEFGIVLEKFYIANFK